MEINKTKIRYDVDLSEEERACINQCIRSLDTIRKDLEDNHCDTLTTGWFESPCYYYLKDIRTLISQLEDIRGSWEISYTNEGKEI